MIACATFGSVAACDGFLQRQAVATSVGIVATSRDAVAQEPDVLLARQAAESGLKTLEGLYVADPYNRDVKLFLAEGFCQYASGFLQEDWESAHLSGERARAQAARKRARLHAARCIEYALGLLPASLRQSFYRDAGALSEAARMAGAAEVDGLFWLSLGLATMIGMYPDDGPLMAYLPAVTAALERVVELAPGHADGLAQMTLGIVLAAQSAAVGGEPERGMRHFERARQVSEGKALIVDVMMARTYAVSTRKRALFRATLERVLDTPTHISAERRLANEIAHRKAARYLAHEDRFF